MTASYEQAVTNLAATGFQPRPAPCLGLKSILWNGSRFCVQNDFGHCLLRIHLPLEQPNSGTFTPRGAPRAGLCARNCSKTRKVALNSWQMGLTLNFYVAYAAKSCSWLKSMLYLTNVWIFSPFALPTRSPWLDQSEIPAQDVILEVKFSYFQRILITGR